MASELKTTAKLGYVEYAAFPEDGCRHEIIDGEHHVNPAPSLYHQAVSRRIQFQLYSQIEQRSLGEVLNAPTDVQLSDHDIVQPDLVVVLKLNQSIMTPAKIIGVPDMIVEIISPSTSDNDRVRKKELYQRVGVPEYWIADPFERSLEQFVLVTGKYILQPAAKIVRPTIIQRVEVRLEEVW